MRERDTTITIACLLIALANFALPAMADEGDGALEGEVDIAYRNVSIDGSERKYDEDYDGLESGFFLGSLVLNWNKIDSGLADYVTIDAEGLGGEPYERAYVRAGRQDSYELRLSHTKQDYRYNLFELIGDEDGHQWDTESRRTDLDLRVFATKNLSLVFGYDDHARTGESVFMKDISRNLFLIEAPIDRRTRKFTAGFDAKLGPANLVFRQSLRRYDNDFRNETAGDLGLETGASLTHYDWQQDERTDSLLTEASVISPLGERVRLVVSYYGTLFGDEELESRVDVDADGTAFDASPLVIDGGFSRVEVDQAIHLINADVGVDVTDWLAFHAQYRNLTQDAEGTFERDLEATGTTSSGKTMLDYEHTTLTGLFDIRPLQGLAIRAGYRTIDRKLDRNGFDTLRNVDFESKGDDTLVFGFYWRPNAFVRLSGNYEDGDIDRSFTNVSPTERRHLRARATFTPRERMNITLSWLDYEYEKPSSEFAARSEGTTWSVAFQHAPSERIDYMLRYANQDVESFAEVIYDGAGFGGPTALITDATSFYTTDNDYIEARINYRPSPVWRFFLHYGSSDAEGRNESDGTDLNAVPAVPSTLRIVQDYVRSELGGRYTLGSGLFFGAELGIFDYDDRNDLLDYDGTSIVLHAGLEF